MGVINRFCVFLAVFVSLHGAALCDDCDVNEPYVDLGDATAECNLTASYCDMFGLEYVCTFDYENRHDCFGKGMNVRCKSPQKVLLPETPADKLKVLAYNVWELSYTYYQNGQHERTCRIPQQIFDRYGDVDVIVFNEAFMGGCFAYHGISFRDMLQQYGFEYHTKTVGEDSALLPIEFPPQIGFPPSLPDVEGAENGGVFIASRWPIVAEAETIYENKVTLSADALSNKGAKYAKIEKRVGNETRFYHILGTHLQAGYQGGLGDEARAYQSKEMQMLMKEQNIPSDEPVIYAGDLNTDMYGTEGRWEQMLEILEARMPDIVGDLNYTSDYENNDVRINPGVGGTWIDYVIYSDQHVMPNNSSQESIKFVDESPFEVCMRALPIQQRDEPLPIGPGPIPNIELGHHHYPYQDSCLLAMNITDLADHYAVLGVFDFSQPIQPVERPTEEPIPGPECEDDRPQVWLGYATSECNFSSAYCDMFGLEEVCTADYKTWDFCYVKPGRNILCAVPKLSLSDPTPASTFKVLAYNVYELRYLYYQSGQHERTCRILTQIFTRHGDVDAIIFNEAFMGGCFPNEGASFRDIMKYYGFEYFTGTVGEDQMGLLPPPVFPVENGGVFIASRWPIVHWDETVYESKIAPSDDSMAAKGAIYAEIEKTVDGETRKYHVLGTHLQAGDTDRGGDQARLNQTIEMHNLLLKQDVPSDEAVIYGGDLNTDLYTDVVQIEEMLAALEAVTPDIVGSINCTSDKCFNDINKNEYDPDCNENRDWLPGSWIDYVLYSYSHLLPSKSSQESIKYVDDPKFTVCMDDIKLLAGHLYPYADRCANPSTISDLSDHYAVLGVFEYSFSSTVPIPSSSPKLRFSFVLLYVTAILSMLFS